MSYDVQDKAPPRTVCSECQLEYAVVLLVKPDGHRASPCHICLGRMVQRSDSDAIMRFRRIGFVPGIVDRDFEKVAPCDDFLGK